MAKMSVGELSIRLSASATEFDKVIGSAEKRMQTFATSAMAPLNSIRGISSSLADSISKPFGTLLTDMTRFTGMLPGMGAAAAVIAHPIQAAEQAMHRLDKLGEDASRLGISGQFLRGLQIAAEAEAGAIHPVMSKLLKFQGQLKSGSGDLMTAGGSSAGKLAAELGLNVEEWAKANPEELFQMFAKRVQEASKTGEEFAVATQIAGKGAANFMNTLRNSDAVADWTNRVKAANVATEQAIALASTWDDVKKAVTLHVEGAQERSLATGGLMGMGWDQLVTGDVGSGARNMLLGGQNWLTQAFGGEGKLSADMGAEIIRQARASIDQGMMASDYDAVALGRANQEIEATVKALQDLGELGAEMPLGTAQKFASLIQQARAAVRRTKAGVADDVAELPAALDAVLEPAANQADISAVDQLFREMRTPSEKSADELARLRDLFSTGMLGDETYQRALSKLEKGLDQASRVSAKDANTAIAGSQEWARAFNRMNEGADKTEDEQLDEMKRQTDVQRDVRDEIRRLQEMKPKVLNAPPG